MPDFPWDRLAPYAERARAHPDGIVDLSVGTPVDSTPEVIRRALAAATDAPGYPLTAGSAELRAAGAGWLARRLGVVGLDPSAVLPTIGSKELVALLPMLLGALPGSRVLHPRLAYPTYDVGARLAGCVPQPCDEPPADPGGVAMVWLNSPSNPTGGVLPAATLRDWVEWGRANDVPVVNDECYIELGWETTPTSILHPDACGDTHSGVLAVHSLSKRSNLAGYRAGLVAGDLDLIAALLEVRKHSGLIVPAPVQAAMTAALGDDDHVTAQRARYASRRDRLRAALATVGLRLADSTAGLYLWATRGEDCWSTVDWLAEQGILVTPGEFYGSAGARHIRVALTVTDERVDAAVTRLNKLA